MFNEAIKLIETYGWAAFFFLLVAASLFFYVRSIIPKWNQRDTERVDKIAEDKHDQLLNHQFFAKLKYTLSNEIPSLKLDAGSPVRQKLFRKLLELKFESIQGTVDRIVDSDQETDGMTPSEWASYIIGQIHEGDDLFEQAALHDGIPAIAFSKFIVWQVNTVELLINYINDLAVSTIYSTNTARINTFLYLLSLQLVTVIGDAEKTIMELNGELSGLSYNGEVLE
jgi:hypothetical protein